MNKAEQLLLDEDFRKILAIQLAKTLDSCPGDCGNEERLEAFRRQLLELKPEELAGESGRSMLSESVAAGIP